jgi:hypothetical protein
MWVVSSLRSIALPFRETVSSTLINRTCPSSGFPVVSSSATSGDEAIKGRTPSTPSGRGFSAEQAHSFDSQQQRGEQFGSRPYEGVQEIHHASVWDFYAAIGFNHKRNRYIERPSQTLVNEAPCAWPVKSSRIGTYAGQFPLERSRAQRFVYMAPSLAQAQAITFRWICSFMGCVEYEVYGDGPKYYCVEVRHEAGDYERSIFNGSEEEWQRDVVAAIDVLRRKYDVARPIDPRVIDAFNAWRTTKHEVQLADILSKPEKYGDLPQNDPLRVPPRVVRGGHYEVGTGWIIQDVAADQSDADLAPSP